MNMNDAFATVFAAAIKQIERYCKKMKMNKAKQLADGLWIAMEDCKATSSAPEPWVVAPYQKRVVSICNEYGILTDYVPEEINA